MEPCVETHEPATPPALRITIMPDGLSATAELEEGELLPSPDELRMALASAGVCHGVLDEVLEALSLGLAWGEVIVAQGQAPEDGADAWFEPLIIRRRDIGVPRLKDDGRVDYFDLGYAEAVRVGDPLMRRFPATDGQPGMSVMGGRLGHRAGKDKPFRRVGRGTRLSADDPNLLVATVAGLPTFGPDFVQVDPVLRVPNVDVSTGHITFAGTVIVVGNVGTGLRIEADGDVIVAGCVEGAEIITGGDIELRGGMVGQGRGRLLAGRCIHARFLEGVTAEAGLDLTFEETVSHSRIVAARDIVAISAFGRGQIVGGQTIAGHQVRVTVLGAPAGTATPVQVGLDPYRDERLQRCQERIARVREQVQTATQRLVMARMGQTTGTVDMAALLAKLEGLAQEESAAKDECDRLEATSVDPYRSVIRASQYFYAGVEAVIGTVPRKIADDLPGASLLLREGRITIRA
jgi:uncharacterized protein (DUF342 family)